MSVQKEETDGFPRLRISGIIDEGLILIQIRAAMADMVVLGKPLMILDLEEVPFITPFAVTELAYRLQEGKRFGGRVVLTRVGAKVQDQLSYTRGVADFEIFDTPEQAALALANPE